jgi:hypothetical protein
VYLGLLLARVGEDEHGWMGALASWAFLPAEGGNRQARLSVARRDLARIDAQLQAAYEGRAEGPVEAFLGRLEERFAPGAEIDPLELAVFVQSDRATHGGRRSPLCPQAWGALTTLAGYRPTDRARLIAALQCFRELVVRPESPADPLASWLDRLEERAAGQRPPISVLNRLREVKPAELLPAAPKRRRPARRPIYARLMRRLPAGSWERSLFLQVRADCRPCALLGWAAGLFPAPASLGAWPRLRRAARRRLRAWQDYAAAKHPVPDAVALLYLEMPEGQHANAGAMAAARSLLANLPSTWEEVNQTTREAALAAIVSVRLDRLCELVRASRRTRPKKKGEG